VIRIAIYEGCPIHTTRYEWRNRFYHPYWWSIETGKPLLFGFMLISARAKHNERDLVFYYWSVNFSAWFSPIEPSVRLVRTVRILMPLVKIIRLFKKKNGIHASSCVLLINTGPLENGTDGTNRTDGKTKSAMVNGVFLWLEWWKKIFGTLCNMLCWLIEETEGS